MLNNGKPDAEKVNVEIGEKVEEIVGKEAEVYGEEEIKNPQVEEIKFEVNQEEHNNVDINATVPTSSDPKEFLDYTKGEWI